MDQSKCALDWSVEEVKDWLMKTNFGEAIISVFERQQIDGHALLLLNENDLKTVLTDQVNHIFKLYFRS